MDKYIDVWAAYLGFFANQFITGFINFNKGNYARRSVPEIPGCNATHLIELI